MVLTSSNSTLYGGLRQRIGLVSRELILCQYYHQRKHLHMEENFIPDTEIEATTKVAKAHKFVTALPDGFNTTVGEQGVQLSGGQK
jgi:ATP-binding cassette subfamily B (MDR/TAP) protein 1